MKEAELYYRLKAIGIDVLDEYEVKRFNEPLMSFDALEKPFSSLESAYNNRIKLRADIIVNALPEIDGVAELSVYHEIKFGLFSRSVKKQCFSLCAAHYDTDGKSRLYFYETQDMAEVRRIFENFVSERRIPDFGAWKCVLIG